MSARSSNSPRFSFWRACAVAAAVAVGSLVSTPAAYAADAKKAELSDAASAELGKLKELFAKNDLDGALTVIENLIKKSPPDSYDYAYANRSKLQVLHKKGEVVGLIGPIEETLRMGYFDADVKFVSEMQMFLVQLYFMQASSTKDEAQQKDWMGKAAGMLGKWFKFAPPPPETDSARYSEAVAMNANIFYQLGKTKEALDEVKRAMRYTVKPKENLYVLMFVCQQTLGDLEAAADTLELLVQINPKSKAFWTQLFAFYLSDKKDERTAWTRAIITQNRAIENGAMNTPKDYMTLFGLYYNMGEFGRAAEYLQDWLRTGKVENTEENWELLSYCYQLLRREDSVVKVLEAGSDKFPSGNLSFALANYYWYDGKYEKAIEAGLKAWKKGSLKTPGKVTIFLAQAYNEVRTLDPKYELTKKWAEEAMKFPGNEKDAKRLLDFIADMNAANEPVAPKKK